jgi:murein L,D-transpeptidase YcbB/YkuD
VADERDDNRYDGAVVDAVKAFQKQAGLNADGVVGPATLRAINGAPRRGGNAVDTVIANMERWRWMPRDLGKAYSILNIPDFTLKVVKNGSVIWRTKVVVGKPGTATPLLSETMKFITVNPTWNVPPSIVANEYLPALAQDPTVMERMGIKVSENPDGTVRMYMPPGDRNALGRLRFNFPNKFLVYQHDTSDKHLFKQERRAYSHGCMRVEDPVKYAEVMLSIALPKEGYTQERIRNMFGPGEVDIRFPNPVPVHITYQTAFVDDAGKLQLRDDLYGRDAQLLAVLKGSERKVADIAIERRRVAIARDELRLPGSYTPYRRTGGSFFNWFLSR